MIIYYQFKTLRKERSYVNKATPFWGTPLYLRVSILIMFVGENPTAGSRILPTIESFFSAHIIFSSTFQLQ